MVTSVIHLLCILRTEIISSPHLALALPRWSWIGCQPACEMPGARSRLCRVVWRGSTCSIWIMCRLWWTDRWRTSLEWSTSSAPPAPLRVQYRTPLSVSHLSLRLVWQHSLFHLIHSLIHHFSTFSHSHSFTVCICILFGLKCLLSVFFFFTLLAQSYFNRCLFLFHHLQTFQAWRRSSSTSSILSLILFYCLKFAGDDVMVLKLQL